MNQSKNITPTLLILILILVSLSGFIGYSIGNNQKSEVSETTSELKEETSKTNDTSDAVVLNTNITTVAGGGAKLTGQVRNIAEKESTITLVGYFKSVDGNEIASASTTVTVPAETTKDYSIDFGPEIAGFAEFDVKVTEVK